MFNSILKMLNVIKKTKTNSRQDTHQFVELRYQYEETLRGDGFEW